MLFLPLEFDKESGSINLIVAVKLEMEMVPQSLLYFVKKDLNQQTTIWFHRFVLQVDYEMGLEYATQTGVNEEPREDIYIESLDEDTSFVDLQSPVFVFRLYH